MKNFTRVVTTFVTVFLVASPAFALDSPSIPISAKVDSTLTLGVAIRQQTSADGVLPVTFGDAVSGMDNGTLVRNYADDGTPYALSGKTFHVWVGANTSGRPYTITSTMAAMGTLPHALGVFPISAKKMDNSDAGGTLASAQDAVGTGKLLYTSSAAAPAALVELIYGLSGGTPNDLSGNPTVPFTGWQPIPPDQATGTYSSTITFTLTLV